jgi:hypothetical protein
MDIKFIIAICIVILIIIIAIFTSNLIVIPFGIVILGLLGVGHIYRNMKTGYSEKITKVPRYIAPHKFDYTHTLLDNWIDLFELLFTQSYPHIVPKAFKITKNRVNYSNTNIEDHVRLGNKWIFDESSRPLETTSKKIITSADQLNPVLQTYIRKYPRHVGILYQKVENIKESLSFIYTITVHNGVISSTTSEIPETVVNIMKSVAIIIDTCISVQSGNHEDIVKQYKVNMIRLNKIDYESDNFQNYAEYLITDWIPLKLSSASDKIIPINTIPAPNKKPVYTFDVERLNQRDFLAYTIRNKWRRLDINAAAAANLNPPVDLHFYLSTNSSYNTAIKNMSARVQGRLDVMALSNKVKLHKLILEIPKLHKYIPEAIIINHPKNGPNNIKIMPTKSEPWIWRPEFGCSGWGIEVVTSKEELDAVIDKYEYLDAKYRFVLSRYITNPKLIRNPENDQLYKFHIRLWAIVSIDKHDIKRFGLFNTGNLITSNAPYENTDYNNKKIHDTHQGKSITIAENSFPHDFPGTEDEKEKLLVDIRKMFADIFEAVSSKIVKMDKCESGFQIFGIDMMVTDENKPVLIEINNQPGIPGYHKHHPKFVTQLSKEFYSVMWDTVINPLVTGAPIIENHKYISHLYTSD